jgi:membrane fusion protein (multidrug efflux system)
LWVVANFKETQLANMKPGQKVEIKLDAFGGRNFEGRLDSFSPASGAQFSEVHQWLTNCCDVPVSYRTVH